MISLHVQGASPDVLDSLNIITRRHPVMFFTICKCFKGNIAVSKYILLTLLPMLCFRSADGSLVLHTLNAARPPSILQPGASTATNRTVPFDNLCYSPINTSTLAASGEDNQVRIWSLTERPQVLTLGPKHSARITGVQTSFAFPDVLYSCSMDKTVVGWDMRVSSNAAVVTADLESPLSCLAVRDDGRLLAAGSIGEAGDVWHQNNLLKSSLGGW